MAVLATVIELSTRGTVGSDTWFMLLARKASMAKLPSVGLRLNASKSESMLDKQCCSPLLVFQEIE